MNICPIFIIILNYLSPLSHSTTQIFLTFCLFFFAVWIPFPTAEQWYAPFHPELEYSKFTFHVPQSAADPPVSEDVMGKIKAAVLSRGVRVVNIYGGPGERARARSNFAFFLFIPTGGLFPRTLSLFFLCSSPSARTTQHKIHPPHVPAFMSHPHTLHTHHRRRP
jgi:hypothetical protein